MFGMSSDQQEDVWLEPQRGQRLGQGTRSWTHALLGSRRIHVSSWKSILRAVGRHWGDFRLQGCDLAHLRRDCVDR